MNRKKALDLILSKVEEDKKEAFVQELRSAKSKEERMAVIRKYGIALTKEEADERERYYIKYYNSHSHANGYNIQGGGIII